MASVRGKGVAMKLQETDIADINARLKETVSQRLGKLVEPTSCILMKLVEKPGGVQLLNIEKELANLFGSTLDHLAAEAVKEAAAVLDASSLCSPSDSRLSANGRRHTPIQFMHGQTIRVACRHFVLRKTKGRPRKSKRAKGTNEWPALDRLGIIADATPALCELVSLACLAEPYEAAVQSLGQRGIDMSITRTQRISRALGKRSLELRDCRQPRETDAEEQQPVQGLWGDLSRTDIAIAIDGGRMNIRTSKAGRKPANKKRHGYHTDWREPKLYTIYEVGENGHMKRGGLQMAGGTLKSPEHLMELLVEDLRRIGAATARTIVFLGDGAPWIWGRVDAIAEAAGIPKEKCRRCLDYYHAVQHLVTFAENAYFKDSCQRARWINSMKQLMLKESADVVIAALEEQRKAKRLSNERRSVCLRELNYFIKNKEGLTHAQCRKAGLPIGSGSIESLVRRVINLRLKGAGMFWKQENAEAFIHMRCILKSRNWNNLCMQIWGQDRLCA